MKPKNLHTRDGRIITLGPPIKCGGEGAIVETHELPQFLAKVYLKPVTPDLDAKLRIMTCMQANDLRSISAWPKEILTDAHGRTMGFLMTKIDGATDVHNLYTPKSRRTHFPNADCRFLIHASLNIAKAFAITHTHKCVIGDVNHGSILISNKAIASLVDCDSFQVTEGNRIYRCVVGDDNYTPPELQGKAFATIDRLPSHDTFGLAVMIFQLLFMGRHPFSGRYSGTGDMPIDKAIKEGRFAYGAKATALKMAPPPNTPSLSIVGPQIASMFECAFTPSAVRPTAAEWVGALSSFANEFSNSSKAARFNDSDDRVIPNANARRGEGIHATAFVAKNICASGGTINIKLMTGKSYEIKVPANTKDGSQLRLRGVGQTRAGGEPGDAIISIKIIPGPDPLTGKRRIVCLHCNLGPVNGLGLKKIDGNFYCETHLPWAAKNAIR